MDLDSRESRMPEKFAVIFTSQRSEGDLEAYAKMSERMLELAGQISGFLGAESVRDPSGKGITVSYWNSLAAISEWKRNSEHLQAQKLGRSKWYSSFHVSVCRIERETEA